MSNKGTAYFEMKHPVRVGPVTIYTTEQQNALGGALGAAVSEGRSFEVRQGKEHSVLLLVSPADNLGNVYEIRVDGEVVDIGVTEKPL
jgi:hypothetical protein